MIEDPFYLSSKVNSRSFESLSSAEVPSCRTMATYKAKWEFI
jgi:hypothetical protein